MIVTFIVMKRRHGMCIVLCYPFDSFIFWWDAKIILFTVSLWDCLPFETSVDCCLCSLTVVSLHNPKFLDPTLCIMWFEKSFLSWPFGSLFQLFVDFVLFETNFVSLQHPKIWEPFVKWNFIILFLEETCLFLAYLASCVNICWFISLLIWIYFKIKSFDLQQFCFQNLGKDSPP